MDDTRTDDKALTYEIIKSKELGKLNDRAGAILLHMAQRLSYKPNYLILGPHLRDEMVAEAMLFATRSFDSFSIYRKDLVALFKKKLLNKEVEYTPFYTTMRNLVQALENNEDLKKVEAFFSLSDEDYTNIVSLKNNIDNYMKENGYSGAFSFFYRSFENVFLKTINKTKLDSDKNLIVETALTDAFNEKVKEMEEEYESKGIELCLV